MNGSDEIREQPLDELAELHRRVAELEAAATGKKRAEQIQTVLFDIARATAESRDLEELLKTIHERLGTLIDTTNFFVALYDEENDIYTFPYWVDAVDTDFGPQSLKGSLTEVVRKTGKPLLIDRDRHRQLVQEGEVAVVGPASYVWLGAPLKTAQKVIGVIAVQSYTEKSLYTTSDLELLSYVSENIAWAIERKQMAEALLEREERLRALVGNLTEGITVIDADGNEIDNIPTLGPDTGYTPGERLGTSIFERVHPDDLPHVQESLARVLEQPEESVLAEVRVCHKDGSWRVFEAAASNRLDNPAIRGIVVTTRDITEQKRAEQIQTVLFDIARATGESRDVEELLKIIDERLGTLIDTSNFFVALYDEQSDLYSFPYWVDAQDNDFSPQSLKGSCTDYVRRMGVPLLVDEDMDRYLVQKGEVELVGPPSRIWLGAPLKTGQKVIGVVVVQSYTEKSLYTAPDLALLSYVSEHIAWAIERKWAEEKLRESEHKYRSLTEQSLQGIVVGQGVPPRLVFANAAIAGILGYTVEELKSLSPEEITALVHPEDRATFFQRYRTRLEGEPTPPRYQLRGIRKDGTVCWLEMLSQRIEYEGSPAVQAAFMDITDRKRAEEALNRRDAILEAVNSVAESFLQTSDWRQVIGSVLERLGKATGVDRAAIFEKQPDQEAPILASLSYEWVAEGIPPYADDPRFRSIDVVQAGYGHELPLWRQGKATHGHARETRPGEHLLQKMWGSLSAVNVPIFVQEKLWGIIILNMVTTEREWAQEEIEALQIAASMLGTAIERRQAEEAEQEQRMLAEVLSDTAAALSSTLELAEVLDRILANVERVVPHDAANIMLIEGDTAHVVGRRGYAERGLDEAVLAVRYVVADVSNLRQMVETGRGIALPDVQDYPGWVISPHTEWIRSYAGAPIRLAGEVIGFLNLDSETLGFFTPEHAERLQAFADQAAIAIRNARLHEQVKRHAEELEARVDERTAELRAANEHLYALTQVKDEFVSNVSHELRTPITNIKLHLHLLTARPEKREKYMATLSRETLRLEKIVEDLLYVSRLDQNRVDFRMTRVDLNELIEAYIADRAPVAKARGLTLTMEDSGEDLPATQADPEQLGRVLSALLTNAINYTPEGGQVVISTGERQREGQMWVGFEIRDTGPGIPPEEREHLFERFFRGAAGRASGQPGTGLGLAIARGIVERHGGRVEVASEGTPGQGATFSVWLPVYEEQP